MSKHIAIIGAGCAGLTAAYELLERTSCDVTIYEQSDVVGGICRTLTSTSGNRWDIGGHRFHTRIPRILRFWQKIMPMRTLQRQSSIRYRGHYINYPLRPSLAFVKGVGLVDTCRCARDYAKARLARHSHRKTLADYYVQTFGQRAYDLFFRSYTTKVWGTDPEHMPPTWGEERVGRWGLRKSDTGYSEFLYPYYGVGQFYDCLADECCQRGANIITGCKYSVAANNITSKYDIILTSSPLLPEQHRSLLMVGLVVDEPPPTNAQWIYVQEPDIRMGRIQIVNNWSSAMVSRPQTTVYGCEYFLGYNERNLDNNISVDIALQELRYMGLASGPLVDAIVFLVPHAYPIYSMDGQSEKQAMSSLPENIIPIGRSGTHRYLNMDRTSLSAMCAIDNLVKSLNATREDTE